MDVYTFGGYAITTGYRGMIDNVPGEYHALIREYEDKARELLKEQWEKPYDELKAEVNNLLKEFLQKVFDTEDSTRFYIF